MERGGGEMERERRVYVVSHCIWDWSCNQIESICRAVRGRGEWTEEGMNERKEGKCEQNENRDLLVHGFCRFVCSDK